MLDIGEYSTVTSYQQDGDGSDEDGEPSEIIEMLADDKAIDIVARLDARRCLQGMPRRLVKIAYKLYAGYRLNHKEQTYLRVYRKRRQPPCPSMCQLCGKRR